MKRLDQLVHTLSYGDAISNEVLSLQRSLHAHGWQSDIFAINVHPKLHGQAQRIEDYQSAEKGAVLLHYSLGSPLNQLFLGLDGVRRALVYHNLTPALWFEGVNPRVAAHVRQGRDELPVLCEAADVCIADSQFNADELRALGHDAHVLHLPLDTARWCEPRNDGIWSMVHKEGGTHLLHVGRLAPNKCIEDIIRTFYFFHHHIDARSRLWLVGIDTDTELYSFALKRLAMELKLDHAVTFTGCLADAEVRALYESCHVYLCMSEHEGFCLPVVEAMHYGLPVIAYACSALPETIGAGGVLVREKRHAHIAHLVKLLAEDGSMRSRVIEQGRQRVQHLSYETFHRQVGELLAALGAAEVRVA